MAMKFRCPCGDEVIVQDEQEAQTITCARCGRAYLTFTSDGGTLLLRPLSKPKSDPKPAPSDKWPEELEFDPSALPPPPKPNPAAPGEWPEELELDVTPPPPPEPAHGPAPSAAQLAALAELKQSILQKAFTGELTAHPDKALTEAAE